MKKRLIVAIIAALVMATSALLWAVDPDPSYRGTGGIGIEVTNTTLNASTYTAVSFTSDTKTIICQCRTGVDIYLGATSTPSLYYTIKENTSLAIDRATFGGSNSVFLKASGGTPVAECIGLR